ncbi:MAG: rcc01693 family protein [Mangrovicoccus sp.]
MAGLDWPGLMRAGMHGLRLHPAEFWALTPAELMLMLGHTGGKAMMDRAGLEELLARFPDKPKGGSDDKQ